MYHHYRPVLVDTVVSRGEFLTSYTPYQAEISQGTLTTIFEFQTMICQLTGMDVANASMYDGSTAVPEAAMMAVRATGKGRVLVARSVHPEYREVLRTYARHQGMPVEEFGFVPEAGTIDLEDLDRKIDALTAAVIIQSPNFFGIVDQVKAAAEMAHQRGALLVLVFTEAVSLGILEPPADADIVAGELQSFAISPSYGGPYAGIIAVKEKLVRQMPGRLVGQTTDTHGNRAFCLTLATREQHIRREKATSNICTNQALIALMATVFMTVYGKEGLRALTAQWASFMPDGQHYLFAGSSPGQGVRLYLVGLEQASGQPVSPEGVSLAPYVNNVSPDGKFVAAIGPDSTFALYALDGSGSHPIPGFDRGDAPSNFTADGSSLYVYRPGELPAKVYRLNLATGRKQFWKELMPPDAAGVYFIRPPLFSADGNAYAYSYARLLSDLYVVDGIK